MIVQLHLKGMAWEFHSFRFGLFAGGGQTAGAVQSRLAFEVSSLEYLEALRTDGDDSEVGKEAEDRIIQRELIELELHDVDSEFARILDNSGR